MNDLVALARQYAELYAAKREAEANLRSIQQEIAAMEPVLRDEMALNGLDSLPLQTEAGKMTVYLHSQVWAKAKGDRAETCDALEKAGLGEYVSRSFNTMSLSAYVREQLREGQPIEPELAATLNIDEVVGVRARRSGDTNTDRETTRATLNTMKKNQ